MRNFVITGCGEAGIYCHGSSPILANLTITENTFGIRCEGGGDPDIVNCILWDNDNGDLRWCRARYSCVEWVEQAASPDNSNFSEDPRFAAPSSGADGDYHLMSKNGRYVPGSTPGSGTWMTTDPLTSPCIDRGDPGMKLGREQRNHGSRINVGAYGGTPFASKSRN